MKRSFRLPLYVLGLTLLAAPAAQAFTIEDQSSATNGGAQIVDPDARVSRFGSSNNDGQTTIKQGNTTLQFGSQRSFDQRYSKEQMFEPNGRPLGER